MSKETEIKGIVSKTTEGIEVYSVIKKETEVFPSKSAAVRTLGRRTVVEFSTGTIASGIGITTVVNSRDLPYVFIGAVIASLGGVMIGKSVNTEEIYKKIKKNR